MVSPGFRQNKRRHTIHMVELDTNINGKIVAKQGDSAEISMPTMRINIPLIKVDGKWFVNLSQWLENAQNAPAASNSGGGRSGRGR